MSSSWHHIVLALALSVSNFLIAPPAVSGQTTDTDSIARAASDSLAAPRDTGSMARADTVDTIPRMDPDTMPDSLPSSQTAPPAAGGRDTAGPTSGSVPAAATRDSAKRTAPASPPAPVDSVLSAACRRPGSSATIARDLLVVVFAAEAGYAERAAAAKSVGGKLLGSAEPGAYYVRVPAGGGEAGLRAAADQLSLLTGVRQVGSRACPSTPPLSNF